MVLLLPNLDLRCLFAHLLLLRSAEYFLKDVIKDAGVLKREEEATFEFLDNQFRFARQKSQRKLELPKDELLNLNFSLLKEESFLLME